MNNHIPIWQTGYIQQIEVAHQEISRLLIQSQKPITGEAALDMHLALHTAIETLTAAKLYLPRPTWFTEHTQQAQLSPEDPE